MHISPPRHKLDSNPDPVDLNQNSYRSFTMLLYDPLRLDPGYRHPSKQSICIAFVQRRPNVFDVTACKMAERDVQHCTNVIQMFCVY